MTTQNNQEDTIKYIIKCLNAETRSLHVSDYGYDLYLPRVMRGWCEEHLQISKSEAESKLKNLSPVFYDAAWELCRRGILRPGVNKHGRQSTADGSAGNGYSVTPFGTKWLHESDRDTFIPTEPGRFSEMLSPFSRIFGPGFHERANQAIRCYGAHAYLACCVMCGAAAESILLNLAIKKDGDEEKILKAYMYC